MNLRSILLFALVTSSFVIFSQTLSSKNYTIDDGLIQSQIRSIGQDKHGYMWFGSYTSGASKFDGKVFTSYTLDNGLCANTIHKMLVDNKKNLWFGTYGDGLCKYDGETFTNYSEEDGLKGGKLYSMMESSEGLLYFGTDSGAVVFDGKQFTNLHEKFPSFKLDIVRSIVEGPNGEIYFGCTRKGLVQIRKNIVSYVETGVDKMSIFSMKMDQQGTLWLGTRKGLYKQKNDAFIHLSAGHKTEKGIIRCIYEDPKGLIWAGSTKGLFQIKQDVFHEVFLECESEIINPQQFFTDNEKNLWIATQDGVFLIKKPVFENYTERNGLAHGYIFAIQKMSTGYWLGGYDGGISILKGDSVIRFEQNDLLKSQRIFSFEKSKEKLIIGTAKGINSYEKGQIKSPEIFKVVDGQKVYDLMYDSKNRLWAGTAEKGLTVFANEDSLYTFRESNGLASDRVFAVAEDQHGNIWIATNNGLNKINSKNEIKLFTDENGLQQNRCQDIVIDKRNNIWISHNTGVSFYDGKSFRTFTTKNGLTSSSIFLLSIDNQDNLWLGNNRSLDKINLNTFYDRDSFIVETYDHSVGYIGKEANQKASYVDGDKIWFGTINGVTVFDPKAETINEHKPITILTDLNLFFDQPLDLNTELELSYKKNHLTFNFVGLSFYSPNKTLFSFYLEGSDEKWSPPSDKTIATFANLAPGRYTFKVKAQNEDGIWSEPATYSFTIIPPFWKTTWFMLVCILLAIATLYLFISYRTKKLKRDKISLEVEVSKRTKELNDANVTIKRKNKDITDSINYAKRIQSALLPDDTEIRYTFDSFFYLYKPKDIVSGDFYWFHDFGELVVCAVGDCTGHGVPGALMSVICVTQINKHVKSDAVKSPEHALNLINDGIVDTLKQQEVNVNSYDGMDIAMCAYNKKTKVLDYSGAYRPLIIVRNKKLLEYAPNRFSLGGEIIDSKKYIGHSIQLESNDCVYMFTDGYPDQFGGPKGKKYMSKRFKKLLVDISDKSFPDQREILENSFKDWMLDNEQVDDILVMGFKV